MGNEHFFLCNYHAGKRFRCFFCLIKVILTDSVQKEEPEICKKVYLTEAV